MDKYDLVTLVGKGFALMRKTGGNFFAWTGRGFNGATAFFAALHVPKIESAAVFSTAEEATKAADKYGKD